MAAAATTTTMMMVLMMTTTTIISVIVVTIIRVFIYLRIDLTLQLSVKQTAQVQSQRPTISRQEQNPKKRHMKSTKIKIKLTSKDELDHPSRQTINNNNNNNNNKV